MESRDYRATGGLFFRFHLHRRTEKRPSCGKPPWYWAQMTFVLLPVPFQCQRRASIITAPKFKTTFLNLQRGVFHVVSRVQNVEFFLCVAQVDNRTASPCKGKTCSNALQLQTALLQSEADMMMMCFFFFSTLHNAAHNVNAFAIGSR